MIKSAEWVPDAHERGIAGRKEREWSQKKGHRVPPSRPSQPTPESETQGVSEVRGAIGGVLDSSPKK